MTGDGGQRVAELIDDAEEVETPPLDLKEEGLTQREALLLVCDEAFVWRSPEGEPYASVPVGRHMEHIAVTSRAFRHWMLHRLAQRYSQSGRPAAANENAIRDARAMVEAKAMLSGTQHRAALRIVGHGESIYIDLGTRDWTAVEVHKDGWSIVPRAPIPILRGKKAGAYADPNAPADFAPLRKLLSHLDNDTFILLVAWCLSAMLPDGPYPILVLGGEQGSGKSSLARLVQRMTDPIQGDLLQPPGSDRDLIACAWSNRVLSFDNLSGVSSELADSLCRLSTGSEIGGRALFSDHELASFSACRPLVINGIPDLAARGDLADRAIILRLPPLNGRRTEKDWRNAVEAAMPPTFAALLDAISCGLGRLSVTATPNLRMADFGRFLNAAEPALPWEPGAFMAALSRARQNSSMTLAEGDCVAVAVRDFISEHCNHWSGLVSELHGVLTGKISAKSIRPQDWPGNARWFGDRLRRAAATLRAIGVEIEERRTSSGTMITLRRLAPPAAPAPHHDRIDGDGANGASAPDAASPWEADDSFGGWTSGLVQ